MAQETSGDQKTLIEEYNNNTGCGEWIHDLATNQLRKITAKDIEALKFEDREPLGDTHMFNQIPKETFLYVDTPEIHLPDEEELMTSIENICINDTINHTEFMRVNDLLVKNIAENEQLQMENTALKCDYENLLRTFELTHNKQVIDSNLKDVITDRYKGCNYIDPVDTEKPTFAEHIAASTHNIVPTLEPKTEQIQLTTQIKCDPLYLDINKVLGQIAIILRLVPLKTVRRNRTQFEYLNELINTLRKAMYPSENMDMKDTKPLGPLGTLGPDTNNVIS
jgi:hypothetical protein